jgi:hypothetical protein
MTPPAARISVARRRFQGSLLANGLVLVTSGVVRAQDRLRATKVSPEVLEQLEKELTRLADQARREPKLLVAPAHEITYFLLVGLADQGTEVKEFTDSERREMRLEKSIDGRVMELAAGKRVVLGEGWTCFGRAGAAYRFAEYYARRHGKWVIIGEGTFFAELCQDRRFTERQSKRIRPGMTVAQVTALLGCPPGDYAGGKGLYVAFVDPFPVTAFRRHFAIHWCGRQGAIGLVLDKEGKVRYADWYPALDPEDAR